MKALTFTIELLEPMLSTGLEGDPNAGVSLKYVAGSVLRGAIIGLYLRTNKMRELALDEKERDLFFNGKVCYLNAYPFENKQRSLPVPFSWQKVKDEDDQQGFYDFCFAERDKDKQYKDIISPFFVFVFPHTSTIIKIKPKTRLAVHTQRDAKKGRSTSEDGAVFRYESVVKGTKFSSSILSDGEEFLNEIKSLIDGKEVLLGGSRTAGYGRAKINCDEQVKDRWLEVSSSPKQINQGEEFTITLLSNALIRDANGQYQADLTAESLGVNAALCEKRTFKRAELVGGFNRKWGLPLPQQLSIRAGSVFTFKTHQDIDESTIQRWLGEGIGERCIDGFGRIAVNLNKTKAQELYFREAENEKVPEKQLANATASTKTLAQKMNKRILRQKLEANLVAKVGKATFDNKISNSQISRLRLLLRNALRGENTIRDIIGERKTADSKLEGGFFNNLKKTARDQFDRMRINDKKARGWIEEVLEKEDQFRDQFNETQPKIGDLEIEDAILNELKREYHLRLIDGVLARPAKES